MNPRVGGEREGSSSSLTWSSGSSLGAAAGEGGGKGAWNSWSCVQSLQGFQLLQPGIPWSPGQESSEGRDSKAGMGTEALALQEGGGVVGLGFSVGFEGNCSGVLGVLLGFWGSFGFLVLWREGWGLFVVGGRLGFYFLNSALLSCSQISP